MRFGPCGRKRSLAGWSSLAAQNTTLGAFTIRSVEDRAGTLIGCFVYYAAPGRTAHVLNVLSLPGEEIAVLGAMFRYLESTGHVEARGRAQPALMAGLALQRWLVFRHGAFAGGADADTRGKRCGRARRHLSLVASPARTGAG